MFWSGMVYPMGFVGFGMWFMAASLILFRAMSVLRSPWRLVIAASALLSMIGYGLLWIAHDIGSSVLRWVGTHSVIDV